jgi:hypothetical protein
MVICPSCQTENRSGAKFCRSCATRLPETSPITRSTAHPSKGNVTLRLEQTLGNTSPMPVSKDMKNPSSRSDTQPLPAMPNMTRRPNGAIFGDAFLYRGLIFSNEHQNHYLVTQLEVPEELSIRVCPNAACGAFFPPRKEGNEKFCTDCGTVLEPNQQDLMLIETDSPFPQNLLEVVAKGISHGSVRAPLFAFDESVAGITRYCLVSPQYAALNVHPESSQALQWGTSLARGLDYLHDNGIWFNGRMDAECFGLVNDRAVWANLASASIHPEGYVT